LVVAFTLQVRAVMQNTTPETIQTQNLENVTGGSWLEMLSGGKFSIGSLLGGANAKGGLFGLNKEGQSKGLAEGVSGLLGLGSGDTFKAVEGKDPQGFGG
jgi:hypothetical protein